MNEKKQEAIKVDNTPVFTLVNFVDLTEIEKINVLRWRNHETIRQWMYHPEPISWQEHVQFMINLRPSKTQQYFLVRAEGYDLGVIDFVNIDTQQGCCDFGLYANPEVNKSGVGRLLMEAGIAYAFEKLCLARLYLEVFAVNDRAIKLYQRFNFKVLEHKQVNGKAVLCLSLSSL